MAKSSESMAGLLQGRRDERARAEAEATAKVAGRRTKGRTEQIGVRITPEHRRRLDWLAETTGKNFSRLFEEAIDMMEKIERVKSR